MQTLIFLTPMRMGFFRLTPDKTLKFKGQNCVGGKLSKDSIPVLLFANADGTEKRKLLVIGKSKNPRYFKTCKKYRCTLQCKKKSRITSDLFEAEMRQRDRECQLQKRKILLHVENCPAHPVLEKLENIPVNTTSVLQPMDQVVTRSLKCHYHKLVFLRMLECIEKKQDRAITLLDAIRCIEKAGRRVTVRTIRKGFRYAGILTAKGVDVSDSEDAVVGQVATAVAAADDDDLPLSKLVQKLVVM
jgi:hypothetical protein